MCVQNFDDSRGPAIRITYRISLRSSSLWDPRHPLLKVVIDYYGRARLGARGLSVQFQFYLVLGGTEALRPASREASGARFAKAPGFLIFC